MSSAGEIEQVHGVCPSCSGWVTGLVEVKPKGYQGVPGLKTVPCEHHITDGVPERWRQPIPTTPTEWLLWCIQDDETIARGALDGNPPAIRTPPLDGVLGGMGSIRTQWYYQRVDAHLHTFGPDSMLRRCAANRRIIETVEQGCECQASGTTEGNWAWPKDILNAIARTYQDRLGYAEVFGDD